MRVATSGLSTQDLQLLIRSQLLVLDIIQQPSDLLSALADAMSDPSNDDASNPADLITCYSLLCKLCSSVDLKKEDITEGDVYEFPEVQSVMTVLRCSEIEHLQLRLSSEFVQPGSPWMSHDDVSLEGLKQLLQVLHQLEVPLCTEFVTRCKIICNQHTPNGSVGAR